MQNNVFGTVLHHIRNLVVPETGRELSDAQLVERFAGQREESAFAALVQRHGQLVWTVCRQVLRHEHDAEDAFQATFLTLARHGASISKGQAVCSWLYHVAQRIAFKAGIDRAKRHNNERQAGAMTHSEPSSDLAWRELQNLLDAELQRLPEKYREPFVLCCLEGNTRSEAALLLGWKEGTVAGRLARARKLLQQRLARRGVTLSAVLCAMTLAMEAAAAPAALMQATLQTAVLYATDSAVGGVLTTTVAALAAEVTKAMVVTKAKLGVAILLAVGFLAAGFGLLRQQLNAKQETNPPAEKSSASVQGKQAPTPPPAAQPIALKGNQKDTVVIKGRVLNPAGKPFAGAKVRYSTLAETESDKEGKYRITLSRSAMGSGSHILTATAEGYGLDLRQLDRRDKDDNLDLHLVKDDVPIEGRILDLEGRPVIGATIRIFRLSALADENLDLFLKRWKSGPVEALSGDAGVRREPKGAGAEKSPALHWRQLPWQSGLIKPVTTGKDGKFRLTGIGRERLVELNVSGPTIQQMEVFAVTRQGIDVKDLSEPSPEYLKPKDGFIRPIRLPFPPLYGSTFELLARPTKPVAGTVRDQATGKPLAGVRIIGRTTRNTTLDFYNRVDVETVSDEKGQYKLTGLPKSQDYFIDAATIDRSVYLPQEKELSDTEGLKPLSLDFDLMRGVTVRGKLIDKANGKPIPGQVFCIPLPGNTHYAAFVGFASRFDRLNRLIREPQIVGPDGVFQFGVFPGPAIVVTQATDNSYLPMVLSPEDTKRKGLDNTSGEFFAGHAYRVIEPPEGAKPLQFDLECVTGRALTGTVLGPDGQPLTGAMGNLAYFYTHGFFAPPHFGAIAIDKDSGQFTVINVDPRRPPILIFQHKEKKLAARLEVRGDEKEPVTVRLQPVGKLTGRTLNAASQPLAEADVSLSLSRSKEGYYLNVYGSQDKLSATTDKEGRFTVAGLVPEQRYDLIIWTTAKADKRLRQVVHSFKGLTWKAGETKDLGEIKRNP